MPMSYPLDTGTWKNRRVRITIAQALLQCGALDSSQGQGITILGDLVLKDKIIVYDLAGQRIGWANYDCSSSVNVSATTSNGKSEFVNAGQIGESGSPRNAPPKLIPIIIMAFLLHFWLVAVSHFPMGARLYVLHLLDFPSSAMWISVD
ncbi:eukaryotic aspartyl protease family protein [Actinidia rufa]|uniref:Eukaryotic aspartyl protease family protein n=1 Tax=Actinidia rufa TaxID=165716 RepID=A0A7J0H3Z9_9ERIC|nr:eukaryotic aspartyl protease family protein [Actinidia rufa]